MGFVARRYIGADGPKYLHDVSRVVAGYRNDSGIFVLVEGVFDGIAVHRAGANAAVMLGSSHPGLDNWVADVPRTGKVLILLDGEAEEQAQKIKKRVQIIQPAITTSVMSLPNHLDPADIEPAVLARLFAQHTEDEEKVSAMVPLAP